MACGFWNKDVMNAGKHGDGHVAGCPVEISGSSLWYSDEKSYRKAPFLEVNHPTTGYFHPFSIFHSWIWGWSMARKTLGCYQQCVWDSAFCVSWLIGYWLLVVSPTGTWKLENTMPQTCKTWFSYGDVWHFSSWGLKSHFATTWDHSDSWKLGASRTH